MCVWKTACQCRFPGSEAARHQERRDSAGATHTRVREGQLLVMWMRVINFSRSFLNSYFYIHHSFGGVGGKPEGKQQRLAEKVLHAEQRLDFSPGSSPGWLLGKSGHYLGALVSSFAKSVLGFVSTIFHRIKTLMDRKIRRKKFKIFTHHWKNIHFKIMDGTFQLKKAKQLHCFFHWHHRHPGLHKFDSERGGLFFAFNPSSYL